MPRRLRRAGRNLVGFVSRASTKIRYPDLQVPMTLFVKPPKGAISISTPTSPSKEPHLYLYLHPFDGCDIGACSKFSQRDRALLFCIREGFQVVCGCAGGQGLDRLVMNQDLAACKNWGVLSCGCPCNNNPTIWSLYRQGQ